MGKKSLQALLKHTVIPAVATPLYASGYHVNTDIVPALSSFLIEQGVGGLFVGGTTGEGVVLDLDSRCRLHEATVLAVDGRVPVLLHIGANSTRDACALAAHAQAIGADAIVAMTPHFYPLSTDEQLRYFESLAKNAPNTPLFLYEIPHYANNSISPVLYNRLSAIIPRLVGMKTSRTNVAEVCQFMANRSADAMVLVGNEAALLELVSAGAYGSISGLATVIPEPFLALMNEIKNENWEEARRCQAIIKQLLGALKDVPRIGAIKAILTARGVDVGPPMPPRGSAELVIWDKLKPLLQEVGVAV